MKIGTLISIETNDSLYYDCEYNKRVKAFLDTHLPPYCVIDFRSECSGDGYDAFITVAGFHEEIYVNDFVIDILAEPFVCTSITELASQTEPVALEIDNLCLGLSLIRGSINDELITTTISQKIDQLKSELDDKEKVLLTALSELGIEGLKNKLDEYMDQHKLKRQVQYAEVAKRIKLPSLKEIPRPTF